MMRIVIVEDSVLLQAGITRLLTDAGDEVVGTAGDGDAALEVVERTRPDIVVTDVRMPPSFTDEGLRAAIEIRSRWPGVAVLVLSQWVEERYATELLAGSTSSVGYLLKDRVADVRDFLDAVERIGAGATVLDPEVVAQLLTRRARDDRMARLTDRERTVLALIAEGRSNQAIASSIFVTEASVEKHI
ncbi:MAG: response regulator transcription factor, partial [Microthrixaceae bacterium]|nr:response regulator transcription factor [Microthrixaceae bacterium]